ncbi:MAG: DUF2877 domain-containing protein [Candidatus Hadarchaeota archaeon]
MRSAKAVVISKFASDLLRVPGTAEVHSVFDRTFNILVRDELVGVVRGDISPSHIDLVTDISPSETMGALGVKSGMKVQVAAGWVVVGGVLSISLKEAKLWQPPTSVENPLALELVEQNLEKAKKVAIGWAGTEGISQLLKHLDEVIEGGVISADLNAISKTALPHISKMVESTRKGDISGVKTSAKGIIGLGPGLTPSGDDFLSGFVSALWWFSRSFGKGIVVADEINASIFYEAKKTNLLSRQLLQHAVHGEVNERVGKLLLAILSGAQSEIGPLVEQVAKIGETSGVDMMVGLLLGARVGLHFKKYL